MSTGNSNVFFSSSSSSSSSSSATTKVGDLIKKIDQTKIKSCVIGISTLKFHWLSNDIAHTALFISDIKRGKLANDSEGILIEYGNYPPDEPEGKKKENDFAKSGDVIYRYGVEKGGLRYYTNTFGEYRNSFCDVGYISLNVEKDELKTFSYLIDKLAPKSEEIWIKAKYLATCFFGKPLNCQTFVSHSIDIIKPKYESICIIKGTNSKNVSDDKKESIVPNAVMITLKKYEED